MYRSNDLIAAGLIAFMMAGAVGFVAYDAYEQRVKSASATYIMIRKDSLERIITNPCMLGTIEYMAGSYILCRRRADYEPRTRMLWASPFPMRPKP